VPTKTAKCQMHREQPEDVGENGDEIQGILQVPSVKNCRRHHAKKPKRLRGGIPFAPYAQLASQILLLVFIGATLPAIYRSDDWRKTGRGR
jgi:hypothetical protein